MRRNSGHTRALTSAALIALIAVAVVIPSLERVASAGGVRCNRMSLRERAAQTVIAGVPSAHFTDETRRLVRYNAGSVILLGHNIENRDQLKTLIARMKRNAPKRLLVAVDEEGGRVARLGSEGLVRHLPSARRIAQQRSTDGVRMLGRKLGEEMRSLRVNWNLAPVLDVTGAPDYTVIGDRSYSHKARRVARYGRSFARGLHRGGLMTVGKHFPGHGRTSEDSHESMPTVRVSMRQLRNRDLKPYFARRGTLDAVMSAHVRFTALNRKRPASLSRATTELLRQEVGFNGILMTDDLAMGAITNRWTIPRAATMAIRAGADMVLTTPSGAAYDIVQRITRKVRDEVIPRARLNRAVERVLEAKGYGDRKVECLLS